MKPKQRGTVWIGTPTGSVEVPLFVPMAGQSAKAAAAILGWRVLARRESTEGVCGAIADDGGRGNFPCVPATKEGLS
jgi:hypothetical protein